jgi:plasmid stabilization system protein ParE
LREVIIADAALEDLVSIRAWLRQPGAGLRAARRLRQIEAALRDLSIAPCRWPVGEHQEVRERVVERYVILYQVRPDTADNTTAGDVEVIRVFGPGQSRAWR